MRPKYVLPLLLCCFLFLIPVNGVAECPDCGDACDPLGNGYVLIEEQLQPSSVTLVYVLNPGPEYIMADFYGSGAVWPEGSTEAFGRQWDLYPLGSYRISDLSQPGFVTWTSDVTGQSWVGREDCRVGAWTWDIWTGPTIGDTWSVYGTLTTVPDTEELPAGYDYVWEAHWTVTAVRFCPQTLYPGAPPQYTCEIDFGVTGALYVRVTPVDEDGDGALSDVDCDDLDSSVYPGAPELCDGKDNDCDPTTSAVGGEADADLDGSLSCADCDDANPGVNPSAYELPGNAIDENCDGSLGDCDDPTRIWKNHGQYVRCVAHEVNDLVAQGAITQDEGDGLVSSAAQSDTGKKDGTVLTSEESAAALSQPTDCGDACDPQGHGYVLIEEQLQPSSVTLVYVLNPGPEYIMSDFYGSGAVWPEGSTEAFGRQWDLYPLGSYRISDLSQPGFVTWTSDVTGQSWVGREDYRAGAWTWDIWTGPTIGDTWSVYGTLVVVPDTQELPAGYDYVWEAHWTVTAVRFCPQTLYPGAPPMYTCEIDFGVTGALYVRVSPVDEDGDGALSDVDCDDLDSSVYPGAPELCDGKDNDCDPTTSAAGGEADADVDGFLSCNDCDDTVAAVNPGAYELPGNSVDENCDGSLGDCDDPNRIWKNHGQYVRCVAHEVNDLVSQGIITQDEGDELVKTAAQSDTGKKQD